MRAQHRLLIADALQCEETCSSLIGAPVQHAAARLGRRRALLCLGLLHQPALHSVDLEHLCTHAHAGLDQSSSPLMTQPGRRQQGRWFHIRHDKKGCSFCIKKGSSHLMHAIFTIRLVSYIGNGCRAAGPRHLLRRQAGVAEGGAGPAHARLKCAVHKHAKVAGLHTQG